MKKKIADDMTPELLKEIVIKAIENMKKGGTLDIEVLLSKKDREKLQKSILSTMARAAKEAVTIKSADAIENGFRIGEMGKNSYVDFTDEAIAEAFKRYLNPHLVEILDIDLGLGREE